MSDKISLTWIFLLLLTIITAALANSGQALLPILVIAMVKFLMVAFEFMDLKKAHHFWKMALTMLILFIGGILYLGIKG